MFVEPLGFFTLLAVLVFPLTIFLFTRAKRVGGLRATPPLWLWFSAAFPAFFMIMLPLLSHIPVELVFFVFLLASSIAFAWYWFREFVGLMALGDDSFPGRNDKLVWAALMILFPPVGLVALAIYRRSFWAEPKAAVDEVARELS